MANPKDEKKKEKPKPEVQDDLAEGELDTVEESIKEHEKKKDQNA
jgi:hypothetical protein